MKLRVPLELQGAALLRGARWISPSPVPDPNLTENGKFLLSSMIDTGTEVHCLPCSISNAISMTD
jgi:hypothetical protein